MCIFDHFLCHRFVMFEDGIDHSTERLRHAAILPCVNGLQLSREAWRPEEKMCRSCHCCIGIVNAGGRRRPMSNTVSDWSID